MKLSRRCNASVKKTVCKNAGISRGTAKGESDAIIDVNCQSARFKTRSVMVDITRLGLRQYSKRRGETQRGHKANTWNKAIFQI
jgi:hypothetical protein